LATGFIAITWPTDSQPRSKAWAMPTMYTRHHTVTFGAAGSDRSLALRFQPRDPAQQSWWIMLAEVFPIHRVQANTGNFVEHA